MANWRVIRLIVHLEKLLLVGGMKLNVAVQIMANRPLDENTWNVAGFNTDTEEERGSFMDMLYA